MTSKLSFLIKMRSTARMRISRLKVILSKRSKLHHKMKKRQIYIAKMKMHPKRMTSLSNIMSQQRMTHRKRMIHQSRIPNQSKKCQNLRRNRMIFI